MRGRRNHGNLFIANLPPDFPEEDLAEAFDPYGIVLSAEVARDPATGARLRYGWVDIATERAATAAIAGMHGAELAGSRIEVRPSERRVGAKGAQGPDNAGRRGPPRPGTAPRPAPHTAHPMPEAASAPPPAPRPQPQFIVERRPLPRRIVLPPR